MQKARYIMLGIVLLAGMGLWAHTAFATTDTFTSSGTWTAPAGVTSITCQVWASGGTGAPNRLSQGGAGGGGGGFASKSGIPVTPGNTYSFVITPAITSVPASGTASGDAMCISSSTVLAKGGGNAFRFTPGNGGSSASEIGDVVHSGGTGNTNSGALSNGTGGGGGAGTTADGSQGTANSSTGGTGGSLDGGNGGDGGSVGHNNGYPGSVRGGGGGGGNSASTAGGTGALGEVRIIYTASGGASSDQTSQMLMAATF